MPTKPRDPTAIRDAEGRAICTRVVMRRLAALVHAGHGNKQIARACGLSDRRVKNILTATYAHLGLTVSDNPRVALALWWEREGRHCREEGAADGRHA